MICYYVIGLNESQYVSQSNYICVQYLICNFLSIWPNGAQIAVDIKHHCNLLCSNYHDSLIDMQYFDFIIIG